MIEADLPISLLFLGYDPSLVGQCGYQNNLKRGC
jgi:hypothetical protein